MLTLKLQLLKIQVLVPLSREPLFLRMAIWLRGLERWYLVLGGVAIGRGFEPQSDLELSFDFPSQKKF
jgi:hypothetical protein